MFFFMKGSIPQFFKRFQLLVVVAQHPQKLTLTPSFKLPVASKRYWISTSATTRSKFSREKSHQTFTCALPLLYVALSIKAITTQTTIGKKNAKPERET